MYSTIFTSAACWWAGESGAGVGSSRGAEHAPQCGVLHVAGVVRHDPEGKPDDVRPEKKTLAQVRNDEGVEDEYIVAPCVKDRPLDF